ncbi:hypothetical protein [Thomasclavelia spiroformis]|nr:hypothetical protein [Thomasclavelia spiroformis]
MEINHKTIETGTVYDIDNGIIEFRFGNQIKKFQFPGVFLQGFLSVE